MACAPDLAGLHKDTKLTHLTCHGIQRGQIFCTELYKHTKDIQSYDFESQVDVNIHGHIFENSLNEIESVNAEIEGTEFDKQKTKRKKDGVFYTPKYNY